MPTKRNPGGEPECEGRTQPGPDRPAVRGLSAARGIGGGADRPPPGRLCRPHPLRGADKDRDAPGPGVTFRWLVGHAHELHCLMLSSLTWLTSPPTAKDPVTYYFPRGGRPAVGDHQREPMRSRAALPGRGVSSREDDASRPARCRTRVDRLAPITPAMSSSVCLRPSLSCRAVASLATVLSDGPPPTFLSGRPQPSP